MLPESAAASPEARVRRIDVIKAVVTGLVLVGIGSTLFWPSQPSEEDFRARASSHFSSMLRQSECLRMSELAAKCGEHTSGVPTEDCNAARWGTTWCQGAIADVAGLYK